MLIARQSTAKTFLVGPILDADGVAKTDEVVGSIKVTKNGTVGVANGSSTLTHDHTGKYKYAAAAGDLDTCGVVEISLNSTTNAMGVVRLQVIEEAVYDAIYAASATGLLPANVTQIGGDTQSATDLKDFADTGYDPSTHKVQNVVLTDTTTTNTDMRGTDNAALASGVTVTTNNDKTGYSISGTIQTLDALVTKIRKYFQLLFRSDTAISTDNATELTELNANGGSGAGDASNQTESLEAIRDRGDVVWITGSGGDATEAKQDAIIAILGTPSDLGSGDNISDNLVDINTTVVAIGGGAGAGARTVTITVDDGTDPIENAKVRVSSGAESYVVLTDVNGQIVFSLDDATWDVNITKPLYTFTPTTLVVDGTETVTYSMTAVSIPASDAGKVTGIAYCQSESGEDEEGATLNLQLTQAPSTLGYAYDRTIRTGTSDANGLVTFTNLFKGAKYRLWRGDSYDDAITVTIATDATSPVSLNPVIGEG